ncbi:MAG: nucleotide exchange factor GrpE [Clostridia bacterium]|nr:nucleotide exchange factor GrpE [Clostridia bacterium]
MKKEQEVLEKDEILEETPEEAAEAEAIEEAEADGLKKQYDELYDKHLRTLAEYENYKRRTQKEKDETYLHAQADTVAKLLPVLDNLERALATEESSPFKDGIEMIVKQLLETLNKMGVSEIPAVGAPFDPNLHSAVMHIDDDELGANVIVEQFQKGYMLKDKVIRYSMVKVAN